MKHINAQFTKEILHLGELQELRDFLDQSITR